MSAAPEVTELTPDDPHTLMRADLARSGLTEKDAKIAGYEVGSGLFGGGPSYRLPYFRARAAIHGLIFQKENRKVFQPKSLRSMDGSLQVRRRFFT